MMKNNIILAFAVLFSLAIASCNSKRNNNINISQSSKFNRHTAKYAVETKLEISNRFGISQQVSIWEDETTYKADVDDLLKMQRAEADSVCKRYR